MFTGVVLVVGDGDGGGSAVHIGGGQQWRCDMGIVIRLIIMNMVVLVYVIVEW